MTSTPLEETTASMTVGEALALAMARISVPAGTLIEPYPRRKRGGQPGQQAPPAPARRSKYGNEPCVVDGIRFDSKREAARYGELKLMEAAGEIRGLELQPPFSLVVNGRKVAAYVADFRYVEAGSGRAVVEDAKGFRNRLYRLKKKLVEAIHGIEIREV